MTNNEKITIFEKICKEANLNPETILYSKSLTEHPLPNNTNFLIKAGNEVSRVDSLSQESQQVIFRFKNSRGSYSWTSPYDVDNVQIIASNELVSSLFGDEE